MKICYSGVSAYITSQAALQAAPWLLFSDQGQLVWNFGVCDLQGSEAAKSYPSRTGRQLLQYGYNDGYYNNGSYWGGGRIAGVVIGCVCFVFAVVFCILAVLMRRRRMARYQVKHLSHLVCRLCTTRCYIHHLAGEVIITCSAADKQRTPYNRCNISHSSPCRYISSRQHLHQPGIPSEHRRLQPCCPSRVQPRRLQPCYSRRLPSQGDSSGWVQWSADATSISREAWLPIRLSNIYLEIAFCFSI